LFALSEYSIQIPSELYFNSLNDRSKICGQDKWSYLLTPGASISAHINTIGATADIGYKSANQFLSAPGASYFFMDHSFYNYDSFEINETSPLVTDKFTPTTGRPLVTSSKKTIRSARIPLALVPQLSSFNIADIVYGRHSICYAQHMFYNGPLAPLDVVTTYLMDYNIFGARIASGDYAYDLFCNVWQRYPKADGAPMLYLNQKPNIIRESRIRGQDNMVYDKSWRFQWKKDCPKPAHVIRAGGPGMYYAISGAGSRNPFIRAYCGPALENLFHYLLHGGGSDEHGRELGVLYAGMARHSPSRSTSLSFGLQSPGTTACTYIQEYEEKEKEKDDFKDDFKEEESVAPKFGLLKPKSPKGPAPSSYAAKGWVPAPVAALGRFVGQPFARMSGSAIKALIVGPILMRNVVDPVIKRLNLEKRISEAIEVFAVPQSRDSVDSVIKRLNLEKRISEAIKASALSEVMKILVGPGAENLVHPTVKRVLLNKRVSKAIEDFIGPGVKKLDLKKIIFGAIRDSGFVKCGINDSKSVISELDGIFGIISEIEDAISQILGVVIGDASGDTTSSGRGPAKTPDQPPKTSDQSPVKKGVTPTPGSGRTKRMDNIIAAQAGVPRGDITSARGFSNWLMGRKHLFRMDSSAFIEIRDISSGLYDLQIYAGAGAYAEYVTKIDNDTGMHELILAPSLPGGGTAICPR
jgi:hypothetical protein